MGYPPILVREGNEADSEALARVHVESWKSTYQGLVPNEYLNSLDLSARASDFREWFRDPGDRFLLAAFTRENELVGFASGGKEREDPEPQTGEIYALYILKEHQRRGIGRMLFSACLEKIQERGFGRLVLYTLAENPHRGFYASLGGREEVTQMKKTIGRTSFRLSKFSWRL